MTLDLLTLAGGRELVFQTLLALDTPRDQAPDALAHLIRCGARDALKAELGGELTLERELFTMMSGERPHAPSDDADVWDDQFSNALLPVFDKFSARAGVPQDWIIEALGGGVVDDAKALDELAGLTAEHMVAYYLRKAKHVNQVLSAIGIVAKDIDAAYAVAAPCAEPAEDFVERQLKAIDEGERYDFTSVAEEIDPLAEFGLSDFQAYPDYTAAAPQEAPQEPAKPTPAPTTAPAAEPAAATRAKRTRTPSGGKCVTLPNVVFRSIRALGVADKEVSACVGIARSTWARVAGGDAEEMGLTAEQAAGLMGYLSDLQAQVQRIVETCGLYGLQGKGGAS